MQNFSETGTIKKSNSISILSDKGKISFIDVRDVAAVAAEALTKEDHYGKALDGGFVSGSFVLSRTSFAGPNIKVKGVLNS